MTQQSFKKSAFGLAAALLVSTGMSINVQAQMASPVQSLKNTLEQPVSGSTPGAITSLEAKLQGVDSRVAKWGNMSPTSEGLSMGRFQMEIPGEGQLRAKNVVMKGLSESGGIITAQSVEFTDFALKGSDKSVTEGEIMKYGPVTIDGTGLSAVSGVISGAVVPARMSMKNVSYEDKTDSYTTQFLGWGPSATGTGSLIAIENLSGTSEGPETVNASIGEMYMDGLVTKDTGIADFANMGTGFADFETDDLDFRTLKMSNANFEIDGLIMDVSGVEITTQDLGGTEVSKIRMMPTRFNGARVKDDDIKGLYEMLEVDEFVLQGNFESRYNEAAKTLSLRNANIEMIDWFNFEIDYDMSNVTDASMMDKLGDDSEDVDFVFDRMELTMIDQSGVDRVLGIFAKQQGVSKESMRMQASAMIGILAMSGGSSDPLEAKLMKDFANAAKNMLRSGGAMTIIMDPQPGLSKTELDNLSENADSEMLKRIGLSVSHAPTQ